MSDVKIEVEFTLEEATKEQMVSKGTAVLFLLTRR